VKESILGSMNHLLFTRRQGSVFCLWELQSCQSQSAEM